ncbi:MAG: branched-chain amino acid transporter permease [Rhizobacter sp.]|nr:branched-chain amino acid transporter permease [Rhizobacter sp.]
MTSLRTLFRHPAFRQGAADVFSPTLGVSAWGLVTGVAMVKSGLGVWLSLLMTFTVYAGSSQLAALPLMAVGAPMWVTLATGFCVNLRFVIFSMQWRPFLMHLPTGRRLALGYLLSDIPYVMFTRRFDRPARGEGQVEYILGGVGSSWFMWQVPSVIGIVLAESIPSNWGLGFAGVLALLGLTYSLLSDRASMLSAAVASLAALAAFSLPFRLHIVAAIAAGVAFGLLMDAMGKSGGVAARTRSKEESA